MRIVVIGGTGLIGSKVVSHLQEHGHEVIVAAPSTGIDILTGEGLDAAMKGTDVVIDLANSPSFQGDAPLQFFTTAGRNVLGAEARAGVGHHVALSVVGTEKLPGSDYFRAKIAQEQLIRESGIPYTIVHSTQFFEFLPSIIQSGGEGDTIRLPSALVQPIAAAEVSAAVARQATQPPANGTVEIAGPERESMSGLAQRFLDSTHDPRKVIGDATARYFGAELEPETLVPAGEAWQGAMNFERWLAQSPFAASAPRA